MLDPSCFPLDMATGCNGLVLDSLPIKLRSRMWLFCCTSPKRPPRPSRGPPSIPGSLPWPANGACFNLLLLVSTFSRTQDGLWLLKSRAGGTGGSRIWSPKWVWPLIMLRRRLSTWNTLEMISFRNQPTLPVIHPSVGVALEDVFAVDYRRYGSGVNELGRNLVVRFEQSF